MLSNTVNTNIKYWGEKNFFGDKDKSLETIGKTLSPFIDSCVSFPKEVNVKEVIGLEVNVKLMEVKPLLTFTFFPIDTALAIAAFALSNSACFAEIYQLGNNTLVHMCVYSLSSPVIFAKTPFKSPFSLLFNKTFDVFSICSEALQRDFFVTVSSELLTKLQLPIDGIMVKQEIFPKKGEEQVKEEEEEEEHAKEEKTSKDGLDNNQEQGQEPSYVFL